MARWPTSPIDIERVRHPGERAARNIMMIAALPMLLVIVIYILFTLGTLLILIGMVVAFLMFMEALWLASIRANGMRVSSRQYPELNAMVENFSSRLGLKQPEVYIMQQSAWNAFATKLLRTRVVVLLSGAVDALLLDGNDDELAFLVGHELGHHAAGHLDSKHSALRLGSWFPFVAAWHRRSMELTCDRVAIACCGDGQLALRGLASMTVGALMAPRTDIDAAVAQWNSVRNSAFVTLRTIYATYPHNLQRIDEAYKVAGKWGMLGGYGAEDFDTLEAGESALTLPEPVVQAPSAIDDEFDAPTNPVF